MFQFSKNTSDSSITEATIKELVSQFLNNTWENTSISLSTWQLSQLNRFPSSQPGITCLLRMWLLVQSKLEPGSYCNATWDGHYCWPPAMCNSTISRQCSDAFSESQPKYASYLEGSAYRICQSNGTWLRGDWTNYTECADSYEEYVEKAAEEKDLVTQVQYILFIGSILSLVFLLTSISIFCWFKSLWCDRVTIHIHLMVALTLRYVLLYIITEAFIFQRTTNYRNLDWVCKTILIVYLYATLTSVNWMFIQGVYLNGKLTTNVFDKAAPFKLYYTIGWLIPVPLLGVYAIVMESNHPLKCWKGYSEMNEIWIILGPIIIALLVNLFLLINILRILLTKVHRTNSSSDALQFQRAAKATLILSPILGINNLLFIYNPGGAYHKFYVLLNSVFGSTQGVFVALIYCYLCPQVCSVIRRGYRRFLARRNANHRIQQRRANSCSSSMGMLVGQPVHYYSRRNSFPAGNSSNGCSVVQLSPPLPYPSSTPSFRIVQSKNVRRFCTMAKLRQYNNRRRATGNGGTRISNPSISSRQYQQQQPINPFLPGSQHDVDLVRCCTGARAGMPNRQPVLDLIPLSELV